jgi:hypothetical protein
MEIRMFDIDTELKEIMEDIGPMSDVSYLNNSDIEFFRNDIPESMVGFLQNNGVGRFFDGLYCVCNPNDMSDVLEFILKGDRDLKVNECHIIAFTAFGILFGWSKSYGLFEVDLTRGLVLCRGLSPRRDGAETAASMLPPNDERMWIGVFPVGEENVDYFDYTEEPMYRRCQAMHGPLQPKECYGFFPALAIAGVDSMFRRVENIKRIKALEHFSFLAQLSTFFLATIGSNGFEPLRPMGG